MKFNGFDLDQVYNENKKYPHVSLNKYGPCFVYTFADTKIEWGEFNEDYRTQDNWLWYWQGNTTGPLSPNFWHTPSLPLITACIVAAYQENLLEFKNVLQSACQQGKIMTGSRVLVDGGKNKIIHNYGLENEVRITDLSNIGEDHTFYGPHSEKIGKRLRSLFGRHDIEEVHKAFRWLGVDPIIRYRPEDVASIWIGNAYKNDSKFFINVTSNDPGPSFAVRVLK